MKKKIDFEVMFMDLKWLSEDGADRVTDAASIFKRAKEEGVALPVEDIEKIQRHLDKAADRFEAAEREMLSAMNRFYALRKDSK